MPAARREASAEGIAHPGWAGAVGAYVEAERSRRRIPGLALAAARHGRECFAQGFGLRDREAGLPATPDTVFGIGSITKSFTCVALLQLAERGKLALLDPVTRYLPEFRTPDPDRTKRMTIHHFMTHTSGLPPLPSIYHAMAPSMAGDPLAALSVEAAKRPIRSPEELMDFIASQEIRLLGEPGRHFSYSNEAYALLGLIVARVADEPYDEYVASRILRPLGMERTTFSPEIARSWEDVTVLYAEAPPAGTGTGRRRAGPREVIAAPAWWHAPSMLAAGFLKSTARDLLRFTDIFRTGGVGRAEVGRRLGRAPAGAGRRILSGESIRRMTHPHVAIAPGLAYGYGVTVRRGYHGVTLVGGTGGLKGVAADFEVAPEIGVAAVELANLWHASPGFASHAIVNAALGLPLDARRVTLPEGTCPPERLPEYAGVFASGEGVRLAVRATGGRLRFELEGEALAARPAGPDAFAVEREDDEVYARFLRDESGRVWALAWGSRILLREEKAPARSRAGSRRAREPR